MQPDSYFEQAEAHLRTGALGTLLGEHVPVCTDPSVMPLWAWCEVAPWDTFEDKEARRAEYKRQWQRRHR